MPSAQNMAADKAHMHDSIRVAQKAQLDLPSLGYSG